MISIMENTASTEREQTLTIVAIIKDLGFPIFLTLVLLYNSWSLQNFLIQKLNQSEQTFQKLADTLTEIKQEMKDLQKHNK